MIEICCVLYYCCNRKMQRRTTLDFVASKCVVVKYCSSVVVLLCCCVSCVSCVCVLLFVVIDRLCCCCFLLERMNSLSRTWCPRCLSLSVRSTRVCMLHSAAASLVWSVLTVDPLIVAQFFSLRNSFVHDDLQLSSSVGVLAPYSFSNIIFTSTSQ